MSRVGSVTLHYVVVSRTVTMGVKLRLQIVAKGKALNYLRSTLKYLIKLLLFLYLFF